MTTMLETPEELRKLLEETRVIAVVGLSEKPDRDSHSIAKYLGRHGYRIAGVNPSAKTILGEPCYPSLSAIPAEIRASVGFVAVFRKAEDAASVIQEAASLGLKRVWIPPGASCEAALETAEAHGVAVVADKCLRVVHSSLIP